MKGEAYFKEITDFVLGKSGADETEVVISASDFGLTRFANNQIHQNLVRERVQVGIRAVLGKKIGVLGINSLEKEALGRAVEEAVELARNQREDKAYPGLPRSTKYTQIKAFSEKTASFAPKQRAKEVQKTIKQAKSSKLGSFGAFSTGVTELVVANSHGLFGYFPQTEASFSTTMMGESSSGYGSSLNLDVGKLEIEEEAKKAIKTVLKGRNPEPIEPGEYEVVLSPEAVNSMLTYLSYLAFGARAYHEDRSFLSGKLGKKVMDEKITISDDALDGRGMPMPFDLEGSAKKRIMLIEKGVAKTIVYDSYLASKYKGKNTGHGLAAPNTLDALAGHLVLAPGGSSEAEMLKGIKKGLYVSRFWYVNAHHHKSLTITGLTRDGTFLIENGEISQPVVNLRFTQSIPEALSGVVAVGSRVKVMESWLGANLAPALRIRRFRFTGLSQL
jgi:predicted Zn-dependent protease